MSEVGGNSVAFGWPGNAPSWAHGDKDGVGTAYSVASRLWYTVWNGIVTEVYFPTVDHPQIRDLQFLFSDGSSFFEDEPKVDTSIERIERSLGYRVKGRGKNGQFEYVKEIISDPHSPCLLLHTKLSASEEALKTLKLYVLCAPHLDVGGWQNNAEVIDSAGHKIFLAHRDGIWLAMLANVGFAKMSVGYVGVSDGWTDLSTDFRMDWEFDKAEDGNVALTGEIDLSRNQEFSLGIAFGQSSHRAISTLLQSLAIPFNEHRERFVEQWHRSEEDVEDLEAQTHDGGRLYRTSVKLLLAHEDKLYPGAMVASLAIPWGEAKDDEEGRGGYHLIWTRDMVQSAMGLLAAGKEETPLRSLIYLATSQKDDGSFAQNFWVEGDAFWAGIQLDETAFPVLLAHCLWQSNGLLEFDPSALIWNAAGFLLREGPVTSQERWEEASGYSPSTLAVLIAALICAAEFAQGRGEEKSARFLEEYADWVESNLERWTVTNDGTLLDGVKRHYVRITPAQKNDPPPEGGPDFVDLHLTSQPPGAPDRFPAKDIVDAGFLELVRYGIRSADDPVISASVKVVDSVLKVETPSGVVWRRYNHDGYGQKDDGGPFTGFGRGRAWPLLTGERGHYELAAGQDADDYIRWMEGLATPTCLIPEQSWDVPESPDGRLKLGRPTGSAVPLLWAHAEYIRLLRSARDGQLFDRIPAVEKRYIKERPKKTPLEIWSFSCPITVAARGRTVRILTRDECDIRFSFDGWNSVEETHVTGTRFGLWYADLHPPDNGASELTFTFFWSNSQNWENRNYNLKFQ
jgi:glucoamylase